MSDIYCKYCNNSWRYKKDYEKHVVCCEYFYHFRRNPEKEMDDYGCRIPTQKELFRLVQELSLKCSRLETDMKRLKQNTSVRHKKVIADCLNHPDQVTESTFSEWWKKMTLEISYIPTESETTEMTAHWSSISNPFLFRVFRRDLVDGIKYLMQHFIGKKQLDKLPIRCFTQKPNVFYVYDNDKSVDPTLSKNGWRIMTSCDFETMIDGISQLFVRAFLVWQRENMDTIQQHETRQEEQMAYMQRVNRMSPTKERGMGDIRKWLVSTLEENAKTEFEFV